jgi:hypothetical protein
MFFWLHAGNLSTTEDTEDTAEQSSEFITTRPRG